MSEVFILTILAMFLYLRIANCLLLKHLQVICNEKSNIDSKLGTFISRNATVQLDFSIFK